GSGNSRISASRFPLNTTPRIRALLYREIERCGPFRPCRTAYASEPIRGDRCNPRALSRKHTIDPYHTPGDQRLKAVRQTDLSENAVRVGTGSGGRFANVHGRSRQPGRRTTGCHQADVVVLAGGAQFVLDHPRVLHKLGEIEDTAVRAEASRDATRHPVVYCLRAEVLF